MKKTALLFPLLLLLVNSIFSQSGSSISIKLTNKSVMPYFISRWYSDTVNLNLKVTNTGSSAETTLVMWQILRGTESSYIDLWRSATETDTLKVNGNTVSKHYFSTLFDFENSSFDPDFYDNHAQFDRMEAGNYKMYVKLIDTNLNLLAIDSTTFSINSILPPAPVYPYCSSDIFYKNKKKIIFGWRNDNSGLPSSVYNIIRIWEKDSLETESEIEKTVPAWIDTLPNIYSYRVPIAQNFFDTGKVYVWQVQTWYNGQTYGQHDGRSNLANFEISYLSSDSAVDFYTQTNAWSDSMAATPPQPPDMSTCAIFNGFENNTFNGWDFKTGDIKYTNRGPALDKFRPPNNGFDNNGFVLRNLPFSPPELNNLQIPHQDPLLRHGIYAAQIGNYSEDYAAYSMSRTFTVSQSMTTLKYWRLSAVESISDSHNDREKAKAVGRIITGDYSNGKTFITQTPRIYDGHGGNCIGQNNGLTVNYWRCEEFNLVPYRGRQITIDFTTATCTDVGGQQLGKAGNHKAVIYIDFCAPEGPIPVITNLQNAYCKGNPILAIGSTSTYVNQSHWEIAESNNNIAFNTIRTGLNPSNCNQPIVNPLNLAVDQVLGNDMKCGYWYQVKLITFSSCDVRDTAVRVFQYNCVDTNKIGGPFCCPNWNCTLTVGSVAINNNQTHLWGPASLWPCYGSTTAAQTTLSFGSGAPCNVTGPWLDINLTTTDQNGCVARTTARIFSQPLSAGIKFDTLDCAILIKSTVPDSWNTSQTWKLPRLSKWNVDLQGYEVYLPIDTINNVKLTVSNNCGTTIKDTTVGPFTRMTGPFDTLIYNFVWNPFSDLQNGDFVVGFENRATNRTSKYNAFQWEIDWKNRWGGYTSIVSPKQINGFTNGEIRIPKSYSNQFFLDEITNIKINLANCSSNPLGSLQNYIMFMPECRQIADRERRVIRYWKEHENTSENSVYDTCFKLINNATCAPGRSHWQDIGVGHRKLRYFNFFAKTPICNNHNVQAFGYSKNSYFYHYSNPWQSIFITRGIY